MKKIYFVPQAKVVVIDNSCILAGSPEVTPTQNDEEGNGVQLGKGTLFSIDGTE